MFGRKIDMQGDTSENNIAPDKPRPVRESEHITKIFKVLLALALILAALGLIKNSDNNSSLADTEQSSSSG